MKLTVFFLLLLFLPVVSLFNIKKEWDKFKETMRDKLGFGNKDEVTTTQKTATEKSYHSTTETEVTETATEKPSLQKLLKHSDNLAEDTVIETLQQDLKEVRGGKKDGDKPSLTYDKTTDHHFNVVNGQNEQHEVHIDKNTHETLDLVKNSKKPTTTTEKQTLTTTTVADTTKTTNENVTTEAKNVTAEAENSAPNKEMSVVYFVFHVIVLGFLASLLS